MWPTWPSGVLLELGGDIEPRGMTVHDRTPLIA